MENVKWAIGLACAGACGLWGSIPGVVQVLLMLMALDLATGLVSAFSTKTLRSDVGWKGLLKKVLVLGIVTMAACAQGYLGNIPAAEAVAGFYCVIEALSIVENAAEAGVPLPPGLKDALEKVQGG